MNPEQCRNSSLGTLCRLSDLRRRAAIIFLLFFCFGDCLFLAARAAQQPTPLTLSSNRFLFVVQTSVSMQSRAPGVLQAIGKLLMSDMNGNLRRGDTLGLWTFNEQLYAGQFPLQVWSPDRRQAIVERVTEFLRRQPLEKQTDLNSALTQMFQVIKNSDNITVILFSNGEEKIRGTPFDGEINAAYREQQRNMQKAAMPFVTVLRSQGGKIVNYSVNFAPWPTDLPIVPTPYEAAQLAALQPAPSNAAPVTVSAAINTPALPPTEKKVAAVTETKNDKSAALDNAPSKATETAPAPAGETPKPDVATVKSPVPAPSVIPEAQKKESIEPPTSPKPAVTPDGAPAVAKLETPVPSVPQGEVKPAPIPATSTPGEAAETQSSTLLSSSPPVQTAAVVAPESFFSGKGLLITAIALVLTALGLTILFVRRSRPPEKISLITRSMDRDN